MNPHPCPYIWHLVTHHQCDCLLVVSHFTLEKGKFDKKNVSLSVLIISFMQSVDVKVTQIFYPLLFLYYHDRCFPPISACMPAQCCHHSVSDNISWTQFIFGTVIGSAMNMIPWPRYNNFAHSVGLYSWHNLIVKWLRVIVSSKMLLFPQLQKLPSATPVWYDLHFAHTP